VEGKKGTSGTAQKWTFKTDGQERKLLILRKGAWRGFLHNRCRDGEEYGEERKTEKKNGRKKARRTSFSDHAVKEGKRTCTATLRHTELKSGDIRRGNQRGGRVGGESDWKTDIS